jgi:tetratricopeptide (TPR) repeat protein
VAETPVDRFIADLDAQSSVPTDAKEMIRRSWANCRDCDGAEFLTQGLAVLSPTFREGLDAYDADDYDHCVRVMQALGDDQNRFIRAHAKVYTIKALVSSDRLQEAGERIADLDEEERTHLSQFTYSAPEMVFLEGYCQLSDLQYEAAQQTLEAFLRAYPDASPRLTVPAQQMLLELANRQPGRMEEVADLMNYAGRRLVHGDAGDVVRHRQQRAIELLDRLIEEAEQNEQSGARGGSSPRGRAPQAPAPGSTLPGGEAREGTLEAARRADPAEIWGSMPPAQREQVLQALQESFPSRYRRLVEQYYEELAKKP